MAQFSIVNGSLQVVQDAQTILLIQTSDVTAYTRYLYLPVPTVYLYDVDINNIIFQLPLSECTDSTGTPFTVGSFLTFASFFGQTSVPNPLPISPRPNTTGSNGTTPYKLISLATTNAVSLKNSGGNLYSVLAIGLTSTVRYLKLYNKASVPTVGTDIPVMTIPVPANTQGAGVALAFSIGVNFPLGIAFAITSGAADSDTGAVGAGDVILNLTYA
jgi:hypothetical protein